ncbi:MAG: 4Fe-4S dicluster domain-containing protein, partial [Bacillota bacterium]
MAVGKVGTASKTLVQVKKEEMPGFIGQLLKEYLVIGPVAKEGSYVFTWIETPAEVCMEYDTTVLPPKKMFHPPLQTMFSFNGEGMTAAEEPERRQIGRELWGAEGLRTEVPEKRALLFAVHPCDVNSFLILDRVYGGEFADPYYLTHRENTLVIGLNCTEVRENCFCQSFETGPDLKEGYDLLLTDLGEEYLIETGSAEGEEILAGLELSPAPRVLLLEKEKRLDEARRSFKKHLCQEGLEKVLQEKFYDHLWEELGEKCFGCGSCTTVCPTCFCYSVVDQLDLTLRNGWRERVWDSCLLLEYAAVALGGNFRPERSARIKQRLYHKLAYFAEQFGTVGCVGCGRCITNCIV